MQMTYCSVLLFFLCSFPVFGDVGERLGELLEMNHSSQGGSSLAINSKRLARQWLEATTSQPKGPFYPVFFPDDTDTDLTTVDNKNYAKGIKIYVQGQVMDLKGVPIVGAKVEIWQACQSGKYNHPNDPSSAAVDPYFQYYGVTKTSSSGKYVFKTIVPGPYPASNNWWRPSHIHFMVTAPSFKQLITQLYFNGDSFKETIAVINGVSITGKMLNNLNKLDFIVKKIPKKQKKQLIVKFKNLNIGNKKSKIGVFNLYLDE